jgi:hypothetical protein
MWLPCSFCALRPGPLQRARLPHSSALLRAPHDLAPCWFVSLTDACKFARFAIELLRPSGRACARGPPEQWLLRASRLAGHSPPFLYWRAPFPVRCPARCPSPSSPRVLAVFCVSAAPCACAARRHSPRSRLPCPSHVLLRSLPLSQRRVRVWAWRGAPPLQGVCCACAAHHLSSCACFCLPHRRCCHPLLLVLPHRLCCRPLLLVLPTDLRASHFVAPPHVRVCVRLRPATCGSLCWSLAGAGSCWCVGRASAVATLWVSSCASPAECENESEKKSSECCCIKTWLD